MPCSRGPRLTMLFTGYAAWGRIWPLLLLAGPLLYSRCTTEVALPKPIMILDFMNIVAKVLFIVGLGVVEQRRALGWRSQHR